MTALKLIECPRDAMQGIKTFIPTEVKVRYINQILSCGFDTVDFGSFVSAKAIPQLQDTKEVLAQLDLSTTKSKLLAIIANERGADEALEHPEISFLGFPFSISESFQQRNTNSSIAESFEKLAYIQNLVEKKNRQLVVYLSMGFGNPYGDEWSAETVISWSEKLYSELGIKILALSDTIGCATPELVENLFSTLIPALPQVEFGAHLHTVPENAAALLEAAYKGGCNRFDGAIKGLGGCPMAADALTGNMPTEAVLDFFKKINVTHGIDERSFQEAYNMASSVFPNEH